MEVRVMQKPGGTGWKSTEYYLDLEIVSYLKTKQHPLPLFSEAETEGLWSLWTGRHTGKYIRKVEELIECL